MKSFIIKSILYTLPLMVFLLLPFAVLKVAGELDDFSKSSLGERDVFGLAYSDPAREYKLHQILKQKPAVLAVGTSRVMQVRSFFFKDPAHFFNGGGVIANVGDLQCLADELSRDQYRPELIILSVDQNFFNARWDDLKTPCKYEPHRNFLQLFTNSLKKFYSDLYDGKISVGKVFSSTDHIGLNAIMNGNGFRYDGSYAYEKTYDKVFRGDTVSFADVEKRIKRGINKFEWGNEVNPEAVDVLANFQAYCRQNNISLVMFFPPYPDQIYQTMVQSGKYNYLQQLDSAMEKRQLRVYNFSSLARLGATDKEAVDGFHGSEVAYLRLVRELCLRGETTLQKYVDTTQFKLLDAPASPVELKRENTKSKK
jgi:hypothetical protein